MGLRRALFAPVRAALAVAIVLGGAVLAGRVVGATAPAAAATTPPDFGANVTIFDPSMPVSRIQAAVDAIHARQVDNEMGTARYALLFKPGTYGSAAQPLTIQVGYYTEVAGLGRNPGDVVINGHVDVYNRCLRADYCVALNNFWRSVSNLTINVTNAASMTDCRKTGDFWAVSQASPMRRVIVNGNLTLMDYCTDQPQWASGGFIADSQLGSVTNGSQQQFLVRDSRLTSWSNGVWNQVFSGVQGAPAQSFPYAADGSTIQPYTTLPTTSASREKPYLYLDSSGNFQVFVPSVRTNASGPSWANGATPGRSLPLTSFFLARPSDSVATIDAQLSAGKNLLLTPGVYSTSSSIAVTRSDTVVLGLGLATLTSVNGAVPVTVGNVAGVSVAGLMVDAGPVTSPALMTIGTRTGGGSATDPTTLSDVFFRVGGPHVGKTTLGLVVNSDHVLLDDIWVWRADHGVSGSVGWTVNPADTGLVVNGANVSATGLFVEHFEKYNVIWNGNGGRTVFFQNEMPYDPPNQAAWQHDGVLGWAAYKVADSVTTHQLWGAGSYIYTDVDPSIHASRAFEVPVRSGVQLHDLLTVQLLAGIIDHVVNNTGDATPYPQTTPAFVVSYPGGSAPPTTGTTPPTSSTSSTPTTPSTSSTTPTTPSTTPPTSSTSSGPGPADLAATTTANSVTLTWTGDATTTYAILRGESGVQIATVKGLSFTDADLNGNTPYVYSVRGPGGTTPQITVTTGATATTTSTRVPTTPAPTTTAPTTPAPTTTAPTTGTSATGPSNLRKVGQSSSALVLGWDGPATASYDILRGEDGVRIATVTGNRFTDTGLLANTPYVYSIRSGSVTTPQVTLTIS